MDTGFYSHDVFIDLKKALDTVDHTILLSKLSHYGICGITNNWLFSYLSNRTQTTQIGANTSNKEKTLLLTNSTSIYLLTIPIFYAQTKI